MRVRLVQRFKRCGELNHPRQSRATKINDIHALYYIRETKRSAKRTIPHLVGWSVVLLVGWRLTSKALNNASESRLLIERLFNLKTAVGGEFFHR